MSTIILSNVLKWHSQGLSCLPCRTNSKAILKGYSKDTRLELPDYIALFARSTLNACLITGQASDGRYLVVLDYDDPSLYTNLNTYTVKTRRGYHCYLWVIESPVEMESEQCEIKSNGSKVMLPGSVVDDFEYKVMDEMTGIREVEKVSDIIDGATRRKNPSRERSARLSVSGGTNIFVINPTGGSFSFSTRDTGRSPVNEIKQSIKITDIFDGPYYFEQNGLMMAHCPAHEDIKPSLSLDTRSNRFRCFTPNCPFHLSRGGDVIDAYQIIHNLSFKEAVNELAQRL